MHPSILAQRKAQAISRIVQAALVLDPEHAEALQPKGVKDSQAAEMMQLEAIADLLEHQVLASFPAVTTVTGQGETNSETARAPIWGVSLETGDGLPAPTLDEPPAEAPKKSTGRKSKK